MCLIIILKCKHYLKTAQRKINMTICILAGGKGKRIGNEKHFICLKGKRLIDYALETADKTGLKIVLSSGQIKIDGVETVKDIKGEGPIAGLYACLLRYGRCLIFPCDMPFLTAEFITFLREKSHYHDITICRINGKIQPQVGVYSGSCLPYIEENIEQRKFSLLGLLEEKNIKIKVIEEVEVKNFGSPEKLFFNINTIKELKRAEEIFE